MSDKKLTQETLLEILKKQFAFQHHRIGDLTRYKAHTQIKEIVEWYFRLNDMKLSDYEKGKIDTQQKSSVTRRKFERICDHMRCADILTPDSTYGDVARFVLNELGIEVTE